MQLYMCAVDAWSTLFCLRVALPYKQPAEIQYDIFLKNDRINI